MRRCARRWALGATTTETSRGDARRRARDRATVQLRAVLRAHVQAAAAGLAAPPQPRGGRRPRAAVPAALAWDPAAWAADPVAYARAHLAALAAAHRAVADAAIRATRAAAAERVLDPHLATTPDRRVRPLGYVTPAWWRALADAARAGRTAAEDDALALLTHAARALRPLLQGGEITPFRSGARPDGEIAWGDVEADLAD